MKSIRSFAFLINFLLLSITKKSLQETVTVINNEIVTDVIYNNFTSIIYDTVTNITSYNVTRIIYITLPSPYWNGIKNQNYFFMHLQ